MLHSFNKMASLFVNFHNIKEFITPITHLQFISIVYQRYTSYFYKPFIFPLSLKLQFIKQLLNCTQNVQVYFKNFLRKLKISITVIIL